MEQECTRLDVGQRYHVRMPYSEVCMHMRIAGTIMEVELVPINEYRAMAQLYQDGRAFSFPILASEAGILRDRQGWHARPVE